MSNTADRVFTNAKVYSIALDGTETRAQALAIKDGKIAYIGTDEGVQEFIGDATQVTDCQGGSILPGFGDAHMHFGLCHRRYSVVDLYDINNLPDVKTPDDAIKEIQKRVKEFADAHPSDPVIRGSGWAREWFIGMLGGINRPITRHDIDAAVSDRPVVLDSYCGHICLFNTKACEAAGLSKDTPEPEAGIIRR
ncbi:MAG: amidohydrolase family protein, partial [Coriobacteriales bacterium]|nr:amidohydrolase family protein [Coriobacteriales bacterium]